jgi:hypothetical protein
MMDENYSLQSKEEKEKPRKQSFRGFSVSILMTNSF